MKTYQLKFFEEENDFLHVLKVKAAEADLTMKEFIVQAVKEKIERENKEKK